MSAYRITQTEDINNAAKIEQYRMLKKRNRKTRPIETIHGRHDKRNEKDGKRRRSNNSNWYELTPAGKKCKQISCRHRTPQPLNTQIVGS